MPNEAAALDAAALAAELARLTLTLDLHGWDAQAEAVERVLAELTLSFGVALDEQFWDAAVEAPKREAGQELVALVGDAVRRAAVLLGRNPEKAAADWGTPLRQPGTPSPALAGLHGWVTTENVPPEVAVAPANGEPALSLDDLMTYAAFVLGSVEEAKEWFAAPHQLLGDQTPAEVARTPDGARRVRQLLDGLEWSLPL